MKLAFLTATFPSLTETFVFREWDYLSRDEALDIQIVSIRKPQGFTVVELPAGVDANVQYLRPDHMLGIILTCFWFPLFHPVRAGRIAKLFLKEFWLHPVKKGPSLIFQMISGIYLGIYLSRHGFDVIHGHFSSASSIALFAHLASGIPFSYMVYANDDLFIAPVAFFEDKLRFCRKVITDTEYNRRMINLLTDYRYTDKISVIYTGLDLGMFRSFQPKKAYSTPFKLLSVGSMSGFKGYPTVLEALSVLKQDGVEFEYRIVGGGNAGVVENLIEQYGLGDSVQLLGAQNFERVREEFERCDALIMASEIHFGGWRDGFPTVIAEAMLMQRLVIATYISDIPNNVLDHETGLMAAEKSPLQIAGAIKYAVGHPDECRTIVENAHKMAVKKYDAEVNYSRLAEQLKTKVYR